MRIRRIIHAERMRNVAQLATEESPFARPKPSNSRIPAAKPTLSGVTTAMRDRTSERPVNRWTSGGSHRRHELKPGHFGRDVVDKLNGRSRDEIGQKPVITTFKISSQPIRRITGKLAQSMHRSESQGQRGSRDESIGSGTAFDVPQSDVTA